MSRFPAPLRPQVETLAGSRIREVSDAAFNRPGLIPLWFGESDRVTPRFIGEAAKKALDEGRTFYTPNRGIPELRQAIADYISRLRQRKLGPERISVTPSGVNAIMLVMQALVDPGDNVVLVTPLWPNCADAVRILGGEARRVAVAAVDGGWRLDLDRLFAAVDRRTRALFINSPGNPTGWMMSADDVATVLEFCRQRRIWLIADEVYERVVYDRDRSPSPLDMAADDDPVISVNSFSKAWCMTGWRLGWLVTPPQLGETIGKIAEFNVSCPAAFVQHAGITALRDGEAFTAEIVGHYRRARDLVVQRLGAMPRVRLAYPQAAFYAFFRVEGMSDSLDFAKNVANESGVGLAPGIAFGPEGEGWLRLCFATSTARLSEAFDRLTPILS
ncbi:MAG TPA: pyridoxal phosphate-dependent aminotransferase [Alphaproteobacteria bacterium]|nr:pyridoxal phosphate-dependent aminotransferase [Alphaproteobacteria bacterium]